MKFGITVIPKKDQKKNDSGKPYEYVIWYRTSDGELHSVNATATANISNIIEQFAKDETKVLMDETGKEANKDTFLTQL